jgi:hypothetical protein
MRSVCRDRPRAPTCNFKVLFPRPHPWRVSWRKSLSPPPIVPLVALNLRHQIPTANRRRSAPNQLLPRFFFPVNHHACPQTVSNTHISAITNPVSQNATMSSMGPTNPPPLPRPPLLSALPMFSTARLVLPSTATTLPCLSYLCPAHHSKPPRPPLSLPLHPYTSLPRLFQKNLSIPFSTTPGTPSSTSSSHPRARS